MGAPPPLRVLILSSCYPDSGRPNLGNFVQRQMIELAGRPGLELEIVVPRARVLFPLSLLARWPQPDALAPQEERKGLSVHRLIYPALPRASWLRPPLLARRLLPLLRDIRAHFPFDLISAEFAWPEGPAAVRLGRALGVAVSIKARGPDFQQPAANPLLRRQLLASGRAAAGLLAVSED